MDNSDITNYELKRYLKLSGEYIDIRELEDGTLIGFTRMAFTFAVVVNMDFTGYSHRYCYQAFTEAIKDFNEWSGVGHPPGNWIKRKGMNKDLKNPNYQGD